MTKPLTETAAALPAGKQVLVRDEHFADIGWTYLHVGSTDDIKRMVKALNAAWTFAEAYDDGDNAATKLITQIREALCTQPPSTGGK
jgi:hypothetical protein